MPAAQLLVLRACRVVTQFGMHGWIAVCLQVLHVGDRFSDTGNDTATRDCCSIVWVANPEETGFFIKMLLKDIKSRKHMGYIE